MPTSRSDTESKNPDLTPGPVAEKDRIEALDVLRGVAVLGILTMNIGSFSMPSAAYFDPTAWGDLSGLNGWIWRITHVAADLKFMAIFSMLFGAGIVLMSERRSARGLGAAGLHYRRMFWLLVFGLAHAHLLWYGDILVWYALVGSLVFFMRNRRPRTLIVAGVVLLLMGWGLTSSIGLTWDSWSPEDRAEMLAELEPSEAAKADEVETYRSGWWAQMEHRSSQALEMETVTFLFWALWRVSGLMLLGMALYKLGVFSARASVRSYATLLAIGLVVGVPVVAYGVHWQFANGWEAPGYFVVGTSFNYLASPLVALGWVSLVMLVVKAGALTSVTDRLAAVGRMAFTNYIAQTVLCTLLFYGHGFGLFGSVDRTGQLGVVLLVWAAQLAWSPVWLRRFHFGPLEWAWRSLVYGGGQQLRRSG